MSLSVPSRTPAGNRWVYSRTKLMVEAKSPEGVYTGQSEPIITRPVPNASTTTSRYGCISSAHHCPHRASVTSPESLEVTLGKASSLCRSSLQGREAALPNRGLTHVVENEGLLGKLGHELGCERPVPREQQEVVGQVELAEPGYGRAEVRPKEELVVRLVVDDVAEPDELRVAGESGVVVPNARRAQVHPAHHSFDVGVPVGQLQQPLGLLDHLARLHGDRAVEAALP